MKVTWLGHSSFLIEGRSIKVVLDPYQDGSVPGLSFPRGVIADYCLCSHSHSDHNASGLVKLSGNRPPLSRETLMVPHDDQEGRLRGMNAINILSIDGYKVIHLGDIGRLPNESELSKLAGSDLLLVPINGHFTISASQARDLFLMAKPRLMVPMHYQYDGKGYPDDGEIKSFVNLFHQSGLRLSFNDGREIDLEESLMDSPKAIVLDHFER